jgi:hypothetical protein
MLNVYVYRLNSNTTEYEKVLFFFWIETEKFDDLVSFHFYFKLIIFFFSLSAF